jgi:hypothetical protein
MKKVDIQATEGKLAFSAFVLRPKSARKLLNPAAAFQTSRQDEFRNNHLYALPARSDA